MEMEPTIGARAYGFSRTFANVDGPAAKSLKLRLIRVTPRALYLSFWGIGTSSTREPVLKLGSETPVNAVVIDIKGDRGHAVPVRVPEWDPSISGCGRASI
jgi:hypothetical protein